MYIYKYQKLEDDEIIFDSYISTVLKGSPFEIIDGDNLYIANKFLQNAFKNRTERILVISVIGPQSSGKSTLLNFLFGCEFLTSVGRCTKGVYWIFEGRYQTATSRSC